MARRTVRRILGRRAPAAPEPSATPPSGDPDLDRYQARRPTPHRDSICNAPRTNIYLQANGTAAPCWLYFPSDPPRWSTERSLLDIWRGPQFTEVRDALAEDRFIGRCAECEHAIRTGNEPLAAAYDNDRAIGDWPTMLEIELSNLCNLECVMCNGLLSSKIRRNREKLPPLEIPFDDTLVEQLDEFLPHLEELRINGGEPLLQPMVHQLGERIAETRPDLRVTIATNGTVLNAKVRTLLERCTIHLNISIDSLVAERYEAIRVHASFAGLMANVEEFRRYCADRDRTLCIMVNPMRSNWDEMPEFVRWCNERALPVWFNTIREPAALALHSLPSSELARIVDRWREADLPTPSTEVEHRNARIFEQLVHQVETWRDEADEHGADTSGTPVELGPRR